MASRPGGNALQGAESRERYRQLDAPLHTQQGPSGLLELCVAVGDVGRGRRRDRAPSSCNRGNPPLPGPGLALGSVGTLLSAGGIRKQSRHVLYVIGVYLRVHFSILLLCVGGERRWISYEIRLSSHVGPSVSQIHPVSRAHLLFWRETCSLVPGLRETARALRHTHICWNSSVGGLSRDALVAIRTVLSWKYIHRSTSYAQLQRHSATKSKKPARIICFHRISLLKRTNCYKYRTP
ncbi:hypothetical protein EV426DRAFT_37591 [Tirmania nivea]|nr:hypothetical protein EV426DRAFT_37591 [Tirmania nivea]